MTIHPLLPGGYPPAGHSDVAPETKAAQTSPEAVSPIKLDKDSSPPLTNLGLAASPSHSFEAAVKSQTNASPTSAEEMKFEIVDCSKSADDWRSLLRPEDYFLDNIKVILRFGIFKSALHYFNELMVCF